MRPLKLDIQGFTCFKEHQSVVFEDLELFAIQGPTGAGKSSILDAIVYALYGQTPRLGARGLESLVSQGAMGMDVALEFEAAGKRYRVVRVWRPRQTDKQVRFERLDGDRWGSVVEGTKVREINDAITQVVGLDFDGFTRAILLPQGEFDHFLKGDAGQRRELLKGLLSLGHYELMRQKAFTRAQGLKREVDQRKFLLENEYAQATPEAAEELSARAATLQASCEDLTAKVAAQRESVREGREVARLSGELEAVRAKLTALRARAAAVEAERERAALARRAAAVLPRLEAAEAAARAAERAASERAHGEGAYDDAVEAVSQAEERHAAAIEASRELPALEAQLQEIAGVRPKVERLKALGGRVTDDHDDPLDFSEDAAAQVQALLAAIPAWERARADCQDLRGELDEARAALTRAEAEAKENAARQAQCKADGLAAKDEKERLEGELARARRDDGAAALLVGLKAGDACPVCAKPMREVPDHGASRVPALEAAASDAEKRLLKLRESYAALGASAKAAQEKVLALQKQAERAAARLETTTAEVERHEAAFAALLGARIRSPRAALEDFRRRLLAGLAGEVRAATGGRDPEQVSRDATARRKALLAGEKEAAEAAEKARARAVAARAAFEAAVKVHAERAPPP
ncbi:MAG TPA: SMC family ATPase, partial [Deinococcales bacterium]|nr:SMC family ATPase [Deinococcales bacterium]